MNEIGISCLDTIEEIGKKMHRNTVKALEREIEKRFRDSQQMLLFKEWERERDQQLLELQDELERRTKHYRALRDHLSGRPSAPDRAAPQLRMPARVSARRRAAFHRGRGSHKRSCRPEPMA